jgi:hypothetical protein
VIARRPNGATKVHVRNDEGRRRPESNRCRRLCSTTESAALRLPKRFFENVECSQVPPEIARSGRVLGEFTGGVASERLMLCLGSRLRRAARPGYAPDLVSRGVSLALARL